MSSPVPPPEAPDDEPEALGPLDLNVRMVHWERTAREVVCDPANDPDPLLPLVAELGALRAHLPVERWARLAGVLGGRLGWSWERLDALTHLTSVKEIRWALASGSQRAQVEAEGPYPTTGWLGDYLAWQAGDQAPRGFHFWTALSVLSAALRRNAYVDKGRFVVWPDFYTLLVGMPATKKGQAMGIGLNMLMRANEFLEARGVAPNDHFRLLPEYGTVQFVIKEMQSAPVEQVRTDRSRTWVPGESHAVWFCEELVTLLSTSAFNPQATVDFLTGIYNTEGDKRRGTLRQGEEKLHNATITFLGGVTPYGLRTQLPRSMVEGGFVSRCVFVHREPAPEAVTSPAPADPIFRDELAERLLPLLQWRTRVIRQTAAARAWEEQWYPADYRRTVALTDERAQSQYGRRQIHALKIAMLLAVSEGRDIIDVGEIERAVAILDEEHERARTLLDDVGAHEDVRLGNYVVRTLERHGGRLPRRELFGLVKHKVGNAQNFDRIATALREEGKVAIYRQGSGPEVWSLVREVGGA